MLCPPSLVHTHARGNVPALRDDMDFMAACIRAAEGVLADYLGYTPGLSVSRITPVAWHGTYYGWLVAPYALALDAGGDVDVLGRLTVATLPASGVLSYVGGWRGYTAGSQPMTGAEALAALTEAGGGVPVTRTDGTPIEAADLSVARVAPDAVQSALAEAAVAVALRLAPGLVGVERSTVDLGSGSRTVEAADDDAPRRIIASRCARWRHVHV